MNHTVYALAFGAHSDDVEISCGATLLKLIAEKKSVAVCDLTEGEMGTRGSRDLRQKEAEHAAQLMGYSERINLNLGDCTFGLSQENMLKVVSVIRHFKPEVIFASQPKERHPDHERAAKLISDASYYSGLHKIATVWKGQEQKPHRAAYQFNYIQSRFDVPSFIVDVSETFVKSNDGVMAFASQFYKSGTDEKPETQEPETFISRKAFLESRAARAKYFGELIGAEYGEGFLMNGFLGVKNFSEVFK